MAHKESSSVIQFWWNWLNTYTMHRITFKTFFFFKRKSFLFESRTNRSLCQNKQQIAAGVRFRKTWCTPTVLFTCFLRLCHFCHYRIRSNKRMLLLVGGLPPGPDRLPSNLVQYYDDDKKTWKILTSKFQKLCTSKFFFCFFLTRGFMC